LLAAQMGPGASEISEIIRELREKLPSLEPASPLEPEQARFRLFDSISQFLGNLARSHPLLLVLDDLTRPARSTEQKLPATLISTAW